MLLILIYGNDSTIIFFIKFVGSTIFIIAIKTLKLPSSNTQYCKRCSWTNAKINETLYVPLLYQQVSLRVQEFAIVNLHGKICL